MKNTKNIQWNAFNIPSCHLISHFESIKWETTRKNIIFLSFQTEMLIGKIQSTWIAYRAEFLTERFRKFDCLQEISKLSDKEKSKNYISNQVNEILIFNASNWEESKKSCKKIELKLNSKPSYKEIRNLPVTKMQVLKRWVA
jgi:hypothetical protein